jgi:hypothetical protein
MRTACTGPYLCAACSFSRLNLSWALKCGRGLGYVPSHHHLPQPCWGGGEGHTDGTDDGGLAIILRGGHVWVQLGVPLQLHPVTEMVGNGNGHGDDFSRDAGQSMSKSKR